MGVGVLFFFARPLLVFGSPSLFFLLFFVVVDVDDDELEALLDEDEDAS
jgi:hypothetical protein